MWKLILNTLINFYNQKGAGPKNISLNFINEALVSKSSGKMVFILPRLEEFQSFSSTKKIIFIKLPCPNGIINKSLYRIFLEFIFIPLVLKKYNISSILAFGNFLLTPVSSIKTVLLHYPYLVDDDLFNSLLVSKKIIESIKRIAFYLTTINVDRVIVQSNYMREMLVNKYSNHKFLIEEIPNPISSQLNISQTNEHAKSLINARLQSLHKTLKLFFVSRFYPHKNHSFLIEVSKKMNQIGISHEIVITVDQSLPEAQEFLTSIKESDVSIINIGEVPQTQLIHYYENAHVFMFPSESETFGNPLIEAMCFSLPILVPRLPYAQSVVSSAGIYYEHNNPDDALDNIKYLIESEQTYWRKSEASFQQFTKYPNSTEWFERYKKTAFPDDVLSSLL